MSEDSVKNEVNQTLSWLGIVFSTLSVIKIAERGFSLGVVAFLQLILNYYERCLNVLLGWIDPIIKNCSAFFHIGWEIDPLWRQVFVVLSMLVGVMTRMNWRSPPGRTVVVSAIGLLLSLSVAIFWGASYRPSLWVVMAPSYLLITLTPMFSIVIFDFLVALNIWASQPISSLASVAKYETGAVLARFVIVAGGGMLAAYIFFKTLGIFSNLDALDSDSYQKLLAATLSLAALLSYAGYSTLLGIFPRLLKKSSSVYQWATRRAQDGREIARTIGIAFLGAAIFLLANAGLGLLGI